MGPSRDLNVVVITFVIFFLLKTLALEGAVLSASHCSALRARVQDCLVLSVVACGQPAIEELGSGLFFPPFERKCILRTASLIQNTV